MRTKPCFHAEIHSPARCFPLGRGLAFAVAAASAFAQSTGGPPPPASLPADETIILSPFEVTTSSDMGYQATETLAGSRLKTDLKDVASQVNVMTTEFLQDLAITNIDEAMSYSLNGETNAEASNFLIPGGAGIEATTNPFGGSNRMRGLTTPNKAHDFFDTFIAIDSYNTERLTFASGGNSILFGNSAPSGTIDTTLKRAQLARQRYEVSYRIDERGSHRGTADLNVPIKKKVLGFRLATLYDRDHEWRTPGRRDEDRLYAAVGFKPFEKISVHAYYETISRFVIPVRNTLLQDHVTPWILAGKPAFNNGGGLTAAFPATPTTSPYARSGTVIPYFVLSPEGVVGRFGTLGNTVTARGFDTMTKAAGGALDSYEHSVIDPGLYPLDVAFSGDANRSKINAWSAGTIVDINPFKNFFVELGYNTEHFQQKGVDYFSNLAAELHIDGNQFLNDRVTPNPNFGRYFFDNSSANIINARNYGEKEQARASLAYTLGFEDRPGWQKWLGRHQFSALFDRLDSFTLHNESPPRAVGDYSFTTTDPNSRLLLIRHYIDPQHLTIHLPFDPLADGQIALPGASDANGKQIYVASWDSSVTPNPFGGVSRSVSSSRSFTWQGRFLRNRVVTTLGRRTDDVDLMQAPTLVPSPDFFALATGNIPWTIADAKSPTTQIKGVVVHPLNWLSASYYESDTQRVETTTRRNFDGSLVTTGKGTSKEYGVTLRWGDKLSLRLQRYENSSIGNLASGRSVTPTPTFAGRGNNVRREVANLERSAEIYESRDKGDQSGNTFSRSEKYSAYQEFLVAQIPTGANAGANIQNTYDLMSDRVAKGYELTLIGNPTPHWRISVGAAETGTTESNISPQFFDFIMERLPVWSKYLDRPFIPNAQAATMGQVLNASVQSFNYVRLTEGHLNSLERKYRVTATTRYGWEAGRLRGAFIGLNYVWRSPAAAGYQKVTITDNPFIVPGLTSGTLQVDDINNPIYGRSLTSIDAFLGYSRRLSRQHKVMWRVQLNVRNLLNDQDLLLQQASETGITGSGAIYTSQQPRSFILTNTFSF